MADAIFLEVAAIFNPVAAVGLQPARRNFTVDAGERGKSKILNRVIERQQMIGIADGSVKVDIREIYTAKDFRVACSQRQKICLQPQMLRSRHDQRDSLLDRAVRS